MIEQLSLPSWIATLSITLTVAIFWSDQRARAMNFDRVAAMDILLRMLIGVFVGGRLFHVLYEQPKYYWDSPIDIFKIWQGGFVFYGGLICALAFGYTYCRKKKLPFLDWMNFFSPIFAFSYAFGRVGCFLNGCCYGRGSDAPWAMSFPQHALFGMDVIPRHPTQLYAVISELLTLAILLLFEKRPQFRPPRLFALWLILHGLGRILMESFREDDRGPTIFTFSVSTIISALLVGCGVFLFKRRSVTPVSN